MPQYAFLPACRSTYKGIYRYSYAVNLAFLVQYFFFDRTIWKGRTTISIDRVHAAHLAQHVKTHVI